MKLQNRLEKLEQATGINEPCAMCEIIDKFTERTVALQKRLGIVPIPAKPVLINVECSWCLTSRPCDVCDYTVSERVLWERIEAVGQAGTLCLPENQTLESEFEAACERVAREQYGTHYPLYQELMDEGREEIQRVVGRIAPRFIYLCRVPGCRCDYSKTEEEWRANANVKVRRAA